ncbi:MAG: AAA family ATPase [Egibacteraceae bacterium]
MRDDDLRARLREANPWWRAAIDSDRLAWTSADRTLSERARHDLGYRSAILADLAAGPIADNLVVLRGPRRVGKSAVLKDLVAALCARQDVSPWQVIYLPADGFRARDLRRALAVGRDLTRPAGAGRRRVWLVDEVTGVDGWAAELKYARDNTAVGDDTVVCTGSSNRSTADAERHLAVGRAGSGTRRFRLLLPMTFGDVLACTDPELPRPSPVDPWRVQTAEVAAVAAEYDTYVDQLDLAWQRYLESGGFPRAVAEYARDGQAGEAFLRDLEAWLRTDVDPDGPPESVPALLRELHQRGGAPLNRRNTAEAVGVHPSVLERRLNRLVSTFAGLWCPRHDDRARPVAGSQAKLYLTDPLLAGLPSRLRAGTAQPDMTRLTEAMLAAALARALDEREPGRWAAGDTIGYFRTGSGNEVDLAPVPVATPSGAALTTPLESKWVSGGWRAEAKVIEARYGHGIVATKTVTDTTHPTWAIPAPLLALLLG